VEELVFFFSLFLRNRNICRIPREISSREAFRSGIGHRAGQFVGMQCVSGITDAHDASAASFDVSLHRLYVVRCARFVSVPCQLIQLITSDPGYDILPMSVPRKGGFSSRWSRAAARSFAKAILVRHDNSNEEKNSQHARKIAVTHRELTPRSRNEQAQ